MRLPSAVVAVVVVVVALLHLPGTVSGDDVCDDEASSLAVSLCYCCCCFCVYSLSLSPSPCLSPSPSPCPSPYPFLCPCPFYLGCVYAISISVAFVCPFDDEAPPPRPVLLVQHIYVVVVVVVVGGGGVIVVVANSNTVGAHAEQIRSNEKIEGLRIGVLVVVVVGVVIVKAERPVWRYSLWYAWRAKALSSSVHTEILFAGGWGSRGGIDSEGCMATPLGWVHPETRRRGP